DLLVVSSPAVEPLARVRAPDTDATRVGRRGQVITIPAERHGIRLALNIPVPDQLTGRDFPDFHAAVPACRGEPLTVSAKCDAARPRCVGGDPFEHLPSVHFPNRHDAGAVT